MTNFEKITETPEALGEFLASLPVADGPWDAEFHKAFCTTGVQGVWATVYLEEGQPVYWAVAGPWIQFQDVGK